MTRPDPRLVAIAIGERLRSVTNATGYYGHIGWPLPGAPAGTTPTDPPTYSDQRVKPYFLFTPSGPGDTPDRSAGGVDTGTEFQFTVTAAGGDVDAVLALTGRIDALLQGWTPTVAGTACGLIRHPIGYVPAPILTDRDKKPVRLYTAIPYDVAATT